MGCSLNGNRTPEFSPSLLADSSGYEFLKGLFGSLSLRAFWIAMEIYSNESPAIEAVIVEMEP